MFHFSYLEKPEMSPSVIAILLVFLTFLWSLLHPLITRLKHPKLPPGPPALPVIGNLHLLGNLPHRSLHHLAQKHGPIMSMRLGNKTTIVVSSPKAAELFLKTHDTIFASRPKVQSSHYMSYGTKGIAITEYGPYWRYVRKLCTLHLLSHSKVEAFTPLRREEVRLLMESLKKSSQAGQVVDLSEKVGELIEDITYQMVLGSKNDDRFDLKGTVEESLCLTGAFNISDYVPFLRPFDLQGLTKRMKRISVTMDQLLEKIIGEHEQQAAGASIETQHKDFVDVLLSLLNQQVNPSDEQVYDRANVKAIILDMLAAAFDTSATIIIWTLAELLRHPRIMNRLQQEVRSEIGIERMVEESDLPKLEYLTMVVKESFRLHPVAPLLIPRESVEDVMIEGYHIPKKSTILVNTFAIGRDQNAWSDNMEEFYPERFSDGIVDLRGHDFQLLPFGSGRRGCPGMQLGLTTVKLALANLVHCFNWELPNGLLPKDMDMTEAFGLSVSKAKPLVGMPTCCLHF